MKRTPLVWVKPARVVGYGRQIIHVLENTSDSPQGAFIGDFLIWKGSKNLYRKGNNGSWGSVYPRSFAYRDVIARLYEEGIDVEAGGEL